MKLKDVKKVVAEGINNPDYVVYVVVNGKIESGWEYSEDAKEHLSDLPMGKVGRVVSKIGLQRMGINPDDDSCWHTGNSIMEGIVSERMIPAVKEGEYILTVEPNELSMSFDELRAKCIELGAVVGRGDGERILIQGRRDVIEKIVDMVDYGDDAQANFMKDRGGVPMDMSGGGNMGSRIAARRAARPSAVARPVIGNRFETKMSFKDYLLQEMESHLSKE